MEIAVCVKMVSKTSFADTLADGPDRLSSGSLVMDPPDESALELALRIKDKYPDTRVTAVSMSPPAGEDILRRALAMGADEAVLISDRTLAGSDTLITARVLAKALDRLGRPDLILCGQRSIDSETGHIGPQISVRMGIPVITNVLSLERREDSLRLERVQDDGIVGISCPAPLICTVCRGPGMIRIPGILGIRSARNRAVRILDRRALALGEQETGAASPTQVAEAEPIVRPARAGTAAASLEEGVSVLCSLLRTGGGENG